MKKRAGAAAAAAADAKAKEPRLGDQEQTLKDKYRLLRASHTPKERAQKQTTGGSISIDEARRILAAKKATESLPATPEKSSGFKRPATLERRLEHQDPSAVVAGSPDTDAAAAKRVKRVGEYESVGVESDAATLASSSSSASGAGGLIPVGATMRQLSSSGGALRSSGDGELPYLHQQQLQRHQHQLQQSKLQHNYGHQQPQQQSRDLRYSDDPEIQSDGSAFCPTTIFLGDLSESIEERELQRVFSRFGRIENIRLIPGKSFGFIKFSTRTAAQTAMTAMNGALVCGSAIRTSRAKVPSAPATRWQTPIMVHPPSHVAASPGAYTHTAHANGLMDGTNGTVGIRDESSVQAAMSVPMAVPIVGPGFSLVASNMPVLLVPGASPQATPSSLLPPPPQQLPQHQQQPQPPQSLPLLSHSHPHPHPHPQPASPLQPQKRSETPPPGSFSTLEEEMAAVRGMVVYDE